MKTFPLAKYQRGVYFHSPHQFDNNKEENDIDEFIADKAYAKDKSLRWEQREMQHRFQHMDEPIENEGKHKDRQLDFVEHHDETDEFHHNEYTEKRRGNIRNLQNIKSQQTHRNMNKNKRQLLRRKIVTSLYFENNERKQDGYDYRNENDAYNEYKTSNENKTQYVDDSEMQMNHKFDFGLFPSDKWKYSSTSKPNTKRNKSFDDPRLQNLSHRAKEMTVRLIRRKYKCPICRSLIGKKGRIWSCGHCFTLFHLTCIKLRVFLQ